MNLTFGRYPTRREIEEYYSRDDVLEYVCDASGVRKVILSFKDEPSIYSEGETPPIAVKNTDELKEYLLQRFFQYLPENTYPYDKPLGAYPSFHFITRSSGNEPWDFVMEADCHGWRKSFVDVRGAVEFLHNYDVPFIVKFSGHRSLHLIILREVFPKEFDGKPIDNVWKKLGDRNLIREMRSIFEQLDPDLLEKELVKRCEISDESESLKLISWTSIVSSVFDDWQLSEKINQKVTERFPDLLGEIDRKILATFRDLETFDEEKVREAQRVLIEAGDRGID